jgi:large subunit ribosomal protein L6
MSRIGKKPVVIPSGITVTVGTDNTITVKGPKGELKQAIDRDIKVEVKDSKIEISRPTDQIRHRALHGLYRSLLSNMVKGVSEGYKRQLELIGVGFKASIRKPAGLALSHNIILKFPGTEPGNAQEKGKSRSCWRVRTNS